MKRTKRLVCQLTSLDKHRNPIGMLLKSGKNGQNMHNNSITSLLQKYDEPMNSSCIDWRIL